MIAGVVYYKPVQKDQLKNCISNQQHCPEFTEAQTGTRHTHTIQRVQMTCADCKKAYAWDKLVEIV